MPVIQTERGEIHYKDYRKADFDNIPYLLIHGAGSQYLDYPLKMRRDLQSIAIDLPGHGRSSKSEIISIENYAKDIIAFMEAMNLEKVIPVGHSMGGGIAQQISLDYPDALSGLILIATGAKLSVNQSIIDGIVSKPEETAYLIMKWSWSKTTAEEMLQRGVKHLLETPVDIIQADYIACNDFDVRDRLGAIQTPTLVIAGTLDKMTQLALNQELADNIPDSTLKIFENSGHQVHVEQAEAVIDVILKWKSTV